MADAYKAVTMSGQYSPGTKFLSTSVHQTTNRVLLNPSVSASETAKADCFARSTDGGAPHRRPATVFCYRSDAAGTRLMNRRCAYKGCGRECRNIYRQPCAASSATRSRSE